MSEMSNRQHPIWGQAVFAACFVIGALWAALSLHFGRYINAPIVPYVLYQVVTGFIAGMIAPRWLWAAWVGTFIGQGAVLVYTGGLSSSSTAGIGFVLLPVFCLPVLISAVIGAGIRQRPS